MLSNPGVHGDCGRSTCIDGANRTELGDVDHVIGQFERFFGQARAFRAEKHEAAFGEMVGFHGHRAGNDVERDDAGGLQFCYFRVQSFQLGHGFACVRGSAGSAVRRGCGATHMEGDGGGLRLGGGDFAGDAQFPTFDKFRYGWMVFDVLVQLRHERALAIPFVRADNVHAARLERVGGAHHGADVEIVGPVLHGDFEIVRPRESRSALMAATVQ